MALPDPRLLRRVHSRLLASATEFIRSTMANTRELSNDAPYLAAVAANALSQREAAECLLTIAAEFAALFEGRAPAAPAAQNDNLQKAFAAIDQGIAELLAADLAAGAFAAADAQSAEVAAYGDELRARIRAGARSCPSRFSLAGRVPEGEFDPC